MTSLHGFRSTTGSHFAGELQTLRTSLWCVNVAAMACPKPER